MSAFDILVTLSGFLLLVVGATLVRGSILLLTSKKDDIQSAKYHSPKQVSKIIRGEVMAYRSGKRDYAVSAGLAVDLKNGKLQAQGRISDELVEPLL